MMWFFAILVVLVMGGVAAVAAGRGAPMAAAYDDRPDALVPRDGELRGEDVRRVRFSLAFRGYRMSEVDALLDRVARELEQAAVREVDPPPPAGDVPGEVSADEAAVAPTEDAADTPSEQGVRGDRHTT